MRAYLPTLIPRSKWQKVYDDLQVGYVVLVSQTDSSPGHWPLGRILEVHAGKDGHNRVDQITKRL